MKLRRCGASIKAGNSSKLPFNCLNKVRSKRDQTAIKIAYLCILDCYSRDPQEQAFQFVARTDKISAIISIKKKVEVHFSITIISFIFRKVVRSKAEL